MASAFLEGPEYTGSKHQLKLSKCGKLSGCKAGMYCIAFDFCRLRTAVGVRKFLFRCVLGQRVDFCAVIMKGHRFR